MAVPRRLGRYVEPAMWTLVALRNGPQALPDLFDEIRSLDGPVGHGSLFAAVARLERLDLVEAAVNGQGERAYRLTSLGTVAAQSANALANQARS